MNQLVRFLQGNLIKTANADELPAERVIFFHDVSIHPQIHPQTGAVRTSLSCQGCVVRRNLSALPFCQSFFQGSVVNSVKSILDRRRRERSELWAHDHQEYAFAAADVAAHAVIKIHASRNAINTVLQQSLLQYQAPLNTLHSIGRFQA